MDTTERAQIASRLATRFGAAGRGPSEESPADRFIHEALERMVGAGACRFGVRADRPQQAGFDACSLAPPMARMIDHTALKPETTVRDIEQLCREALENCFASVCINPCYVPLAASALAGSSIAVCTVIGFPLGASRAETKALEAELALAEGASEIDMVLNVGMLKSGEYQYVEDDIRAVIEAARPTRHAPHGSHRALVKVILETALLSDEEKVIACILCQNAGADFVKTSTGFSKSGATAADVALMRRVVGDRMGVKASGGVRSREDVETMISHGATRIGASASVAIMKGTAGSDSY